MSYVSRDIEDCMIKISRLNPFDKYYDVQKAELEREMEDSWSDQQMRMSHRRRYQQEDCAERQSEQDYLEKLQYGE